MSSRYWPEFLAAMHEELESLKAMNVYRKVNALPPGRKAIGPKWVLHVKHNEDGIIACFKAHLVAQGFTQILSQDFNHTFAPITRWDSICFILSIAAVFNYELRHIDIKTTYLNGVLNEEIYLKHPNVIGSGYWLLLKALYGLCQSGREWYLNINTTFTELDFKQCESDWSVHLHRTDTSLSITATSVDDILHLADSIVEASRFTEELKTRYQITDNGGVTWLLGCQITCWRSCRSLKLEQKQYVTSILKEYGLMNCNAMKAPMITCLTTNIHPQTADKIAIAKKLPYRELVGKLMYLSTCT
jgi:hypothetical protein